MKKLIGLVVLGAALAQIPAPTQMTDKEKVEFIDMQGRLIDMSKKASKAIDEAQAYRVVVERRMEELKVSHGAATCQIDQGLRFVDCKAPEKGKK